MKFTALIAASAAAATLVLAPGAASAVELLTNGGFEDIGAGAVPESWGGLTYYTDGVHQSPGGFDQPPIGVLLPGWKVKSGSVDLTWSTSDWGPTPGPLPDTYSLDINGWNAGTIAQSFGTTFGKTYRVSYDYSRNVYDGSAANALVSVGGIDHAVLTVNDPSTYGYAHHMKWVSDSFTFVGDGNLATITLKATTEGNAGVFFDNVSVAVPEPATWALMIGGFGMAGAMLRRRRSLAAA